MSRFDSGLAAKADSEIPAAAEVTSAKREEEEEEEARKLEEFRVEEGVGFLRKSEVREKELVVSKNLEAEELT